MSCFGCCGGDDFRRVAETGPKPVYGAAGTF